MTCGDCDECPFDATSQQSVVPQQIHVTVNADRGHFESICSRIGVKALAIKNIFRGGIDRTELITSSLTYECDAAAYREMARISKTFCSAGLEVIREKIEVAPWHVDTPTRENHKRLRAGQYFESHLVVLTDSEDSCKKLSDVSLIEGVHLSRNETKWRAGVHKTMATLRSTTVGNVDNFNDRVAGVVERLRRRGLEVEKAIIEFARFDSNVALDGPWMSEP